MKNLFLSIGTVLSVLSPLAASAAPVNVIDFEAKTQLSSRWERPENRKLLEERMRISHSNSFTKEFFENAFKSNVVEIQKFSNAFLCRSGQDTNRCKPVSK